MSHGIPSATGKQAILHYSCTGPEVSSRNSMLEPCPRLTFSAHQSRSPVFPFRIQHRTRRTEPVEAAAVSNLYVTTESFYSLLGIPESGTLSEIKQAYKQLARKYHPDVSPPDCTEEYTKKFIQVQEAYEILSDPTRRASHDRDIASGLHMAFSARRQFNFKMRNEREDWRNQWESQLTELKRRSVNDDLIRQNNTSWGARMRQAKQVKSH